MAQGAAGDLFRAAREGAFSWQAFRSGTAVCRTPFCLLKGKRPWPFGLLPLLLSASPRLRCQQRDMEEQQGEQRTSDIFDSPAGPALLC